MLPVAEIGGGGWTCGARARHHHRGRSRNLGFLALNQTAVCASSSTDVERRQRQQLGRALRAPRRQANSPLTSRRACARGTSSSSRETRRPRGRVCVVRGRRGTTPTAADRTASRWRLAKAPSKQQPSHLAKGWRKEGVFIRHLAHIRTAACDVASSCRAPLRHRRKQLACHKRQPAASTRRTGNVPCKGPTQGSRAASVLRAAREQQERHAPHRTTTATVRVEDDDGSSRAPRGEQSVPHR